MIILYRILTYILVPFALLFGLFTLILFFIAISNPALFLGVFLLAAFIIYYFCSFRFLHNGLLNKQQLKPKLRDWIKVNAYVTLPFAIMNFMQGFMLIRKPALIDESIKQMLEMQQRMGVPAQPAGTYNSMMMTVLYIILFFSIVLLVHVMLTFSFLKKYEHLFTSGEEIPS
jgi:hypothetical protein